MERHARCLVRAQLLKERRPRWLQVLLLNHTHGSYGKPDKKGRRLKVVGLARPTIDTKAMARVVLDLAEQLEAEQKAKPEGDTAGEEKAA